MRESVRALSRGVKTSSSGSFWQGDIFREFQGKEGGCMVGEMQGTEGRRSRMPPLHSAEKTSKEGGKGESRLLGQNIQCS